MRLSLYNYPRLVILMLLLIVAFGTSAIVNMPRLEDPHLEGRIVVILTNYPGASAERVEALVTEKIERQVRELPEVKKIRSTSRPGISVVTVDLIDEVMDADPVVSRLRDKLSEIEDFPNGVLQPRIDENRMYAATAILGLVWEGEEQPNFALLGRYADELEVKLKNIRGTDFVEIKGLPSEEIAITLKNDALSVLNLSGDELASMIAAADPKAPAGRINGRDGEFLVEVEGSFEALQRIRDIPIAVDEEGSATRLGDIAEVQRVIADPAEGKALLFGQYGVTVAARAHENTRVDIWATSLYAMLDQYKSSLPNNIRVEILFDQSQYTTERLSSLIGNMVVGALIVFAILIVTLGWRASMIAGSILPLATLSALGILYALDFRIQQMVVTGLIVGLGIMVDNAIVVTESIQSFLLAGQRRAVAVAKTIERLWLPLLGSTATTVIAFLPILLMPGNAGEFVGGISAAVIASLVASYLIAFILISAIAGKLLSAEPNPNDKQRTWFRDGIAAKGVAIWFENSLTASLQRPWRTIGLVSVLPFIGIILGGTLTEQFFPQGDRDQFQIIMRLPSQSSLYETEEMVRNAHALVSQDPRVKAVHWTMGQSFSKFYYNIIGNGDGVSSQAEAMVTATSMEEVDGLIATLQPLLDEAFPAAQTLVKNLEQGPPFDAPVELKIIGPDLEVLREVGEKVRFQLTQIEHVTHTRALLIAGRPKLLVDVNEDEAAILGLDLRDIASQLRGGLDGSIGGSVIEETEEIPVRVRFEGDDRDSVTALAGIRLRPRNGVSAPDGGYVGIPLEAIAEIKTEASIGAIQRLNGQRLNTIQAFIENNVLPQTVFNELQARLDVLDIELPPGYRIEFGGEIAERNDAVSKLMGAAGVLAVLLIFAVVLTFDSFRLAAVTFVAAIQAAGLGMLALWFGNFPLGFVVIVAVMGLVGLAINAAIVILSEIKSNRAARAGDISEIVAGVKTTGRHIFSTTLTTVGGFLPLMMTSGEFWPPFAITIAMGTFLSMLVSFYFAPAAFKLMADRRAFTGKRAKLAEQAAAITAATRI